MAKLTLTLLGGFEVRIDNAVPVGLPTRKARALLVWLALNPERRVSRDAAMGLLWGSSPQKQASASLSQTIYAIRKVLGENGCDALEVDSETILFALADAEVDALRFSSLARERDHVSLAEAGILNRGAFLDNFPAPTPEFENWMTTERRRIRAKEVTALTVLMTTLAARGEDDARAATAQRLFELDNYNEPAARVLMLHHAVHGQTGLAAEVFERLCSDLDNDLGAEPSPETVELKRRILQHEISVPAVAPARVLNTTGLPKPASAKVIRHVVATSRS